MITVEEATQIIAQTAKDTSVAIVPLHHSVGRVLREDLFADRDFPPYHRITMDGIAIRYDAFEKGEKTFPIEGVAAAGAPQLTMQHDTACLEVMTGAILPNNTDTVIRYEDLLIENGRATLQVPQLTRGQNVHNKGEDRLQNSLVVKKGKIISPAEIGVAATVGKSEIKVSRLPKAIIISTGDELVEIDETPLAHQIRKSNVHVSGEH